MKSVIPCPLLQGAKKNLLFIKKEDRTFSYQDILQRSFLLESFFREKNLKRGDVVSSHFSSPFENIILFLACFRSSLIFNPINPKSPPDLRKKLNNKVKPKLIFSEEKEISAILSSPQKEIDLIEKINLDEACLIIFSSGTSSFPKATVLSKMNLYASANASREIINLKEEDSWGLSLPLFHISGISIVMRCLFAGACICLDESKPSSIVSWVPTQLKRHLDFLSSSKIKQTPIKTILLGGAPCPPHLLEKILECDLRLYYSYGMTEMSSQIYTERLFLKDEKIHTEGKFLPGIELRISKEKEILVKGPMLFLGYLDEKGEIKKKLDEEGFFATNDLGVLENGKLKIIGRKDNQFISGGENIQPEAIESVLLKLLPHLQAAMVVEKEDEEYGFIPVAFLDECPLNLDSLKEDLREKLPPFMIPKAFYKIPKDKLREGLKISRAQLRDCAKKIKAP